MKINEIITEDVTAYTDAELEELYRRAKEEGEESLSSTERTALLQRMQAATAVTKGQPVAGPQAYHTQPSLATSTNPDYTGLQQELNQAVQAARAQKRNSVAGPQAYHTKVATPVAKASTTRSPHISSPTKQAPSRFADFNPDGTVKGTAGSRQRSKASYKKHARGSLASDYGV
jgi:hypothetical protein